MADMAEMADVLAAWEYLQAVRRREQKIMPISYMNTAAGLKAFTGRNGGLICTSSNAKAALEYALQSREKVFFFPGSTSRIQYRSGIWPEAGSDGHLGFLA